MSPATVIQSAFSRFFTEAARRIDLRDDRLVLLNDLRRVLLVEHGEVDLFAVRLVDGQPTGRWTPLCRVPSGTILWSSPRGPKHSIVGRAVPGAVLSYLPVERLTGLSARHAVGDGAAGRVIRDLSPVGFAVAVRQLVVGIEAGLIALADALRGELPPRKFVPLVPRGVTELTDHAAVRSIDGVQWVYVESGVARGNGLAGRLTAGGHMCLTERDWMITEGPALLLSRATGELLADGSLWGKLITHASRLLYAVDRRVEQRESAERESLAARASRESDAVQAAARSFDAVVRDTRSPVRLADVAADPPDLAAMRLVASHLGFSVQPPAAGDRSGRRMDPIQRIALANGVRTRELRLGATWWKRDLGPMLGRRASDGRVLALLPVKGYYVVADPQANQLTRVNRAVAEDFEDRAVAVYRPLPDGVTGVGALLKFGASGLRRDLVRILLTGAVVAALGMLVPIMTGRVLGTFVAQAQRSLIVEGSLLVIAGAFVAAVISVVQNIAALRLEGRSVALLQSAVWSRLLSLPTTFFSRYSTGELAVSALGVNAAQEALSSVTTTAALGLLTGSANLVLVFFYDVKLALVAVALVAIFAGVSLLAGIREVRWQRRLYDQERKLSSRVFQLLTGLPKLRVAAAEDRAFAEWSTTFTRGRGMAVKARRVQNSLTTFNAAFPLICMVIIFGLVAGPLRGEISIAAFLSFNAAFALLTASALQFTGVAITTLGVFPMLERIKPILEEEPEASAGSADPGDLSGQITFSHVSFRYGEDKPLVLDDISFNIDPGEFVAIVGPTGCGKSTLLRLLLGFESPTTGSVLYDGQDLSQLEASAVRRQCGVVLQNGALLAGDIKSNIIGSSSHTLDDAWAAARMAGIEGEIAAMPMGMQTLLSEGATTLSGGQRQRIMIARALVSRPRILLFDEATSALDNPTQKVVAESMRQLNATRVIIAHRLSSVAGADRIIVLDGGQIIQQGSYDELLADAGGLFASLASKQLT
jgi:NHLM bacteriocin system ABC transporter ATP-binding protein